jgi:uncharacterized protein
LVRTFNKAPSHLISDTSCRKYGFIKFKVEVDVNEAYDIIDAVVLKVKIKLRRTYNWLLNSYKRLLNPAISNEAFKKLKLRLIPIRFRFLLIIWDNCCWRTFGRKTNFAIDPGFRSGCKIVCLDEKEIYNETIYPHAQKKRRWR